MQIEIKNRFNGEIIITGEYASIKDAVEKNVGANLEGANLGGAYLGGANLRGANLRGANLGGANLRGAKGIKLPIISIQGSKHYFYYHNGKIKIGCENHPVWHWLENYKSIGKHYEYTDKQIKEYGNYIKFCAKLSEVK